MPGPGNKLVIINGWPWVRVDQANTQAGWGYSESMVRQCHGDPREVERRTGGVVITETKATSRNSD